MKALRNKPIKRRSDNKLSLVIVFCMLLLLQSACSQGSSPHDELVERGFYAYVVPDDVLSEREWILSTPVKEKSWQWNLHCEGGASAPENPLILRYLKRGGEPQLSIWISARGSMWDHNKQTRSIALHTPWVKEEKGIVYKDQPLSPLRFEDIFGNQVIVRGEQTVAEKINLVDQFEYVGPPVEDMISPWSMDWCEEMN